MAIVKEINQKGWDEWKAGRPLVVQELCKKLPPDRLYMLKMSNHRVTIYSYSEDGTVTVNVTGEYNAITFDRQVFGVSPDDLEECDLPREGEQVGTLFTDDADVQAFIDQVKTSKGET